MIRSLALCPLRAGRALVISPVGAILFVVLLAFTGCSKSAGPLSQTAQGAQVSHTYATPAMYRVRVTAATTGHAAEPNQRRQARRVQDALRWPTSAFPVHAGADPPPPCAYGRRLLLQRALPRGLDLVDDDLQPRGIPAVARVPFLRAVGDRDEQIDIGAQVDVVPGL